MKKKHINYLIKQLRQDRALIRRFWKSYPVGKSDKNMVRNYKFQLEIIRALQVLKGEIK